MIQTSANLSPASSLSCTLERNINDERPAEALRLLRKVLTEVDENREPTDNLN